MECDSNLDTTVDAIWLMSATIVIIIVGILANRI